MARPWPSQSRFLGVQQDIGWEPLIWGEGEYQGKLLIYLQVYVSREQTTHVETGTIVQYDSFRFVLSLFQTTYNILSYNTVNTGKVAV